MRACRSTAPGRLVPARGWVKTCAQSPPSPPSRVVWRVARALATRSRWTAPASRAAVTRRARMVSSVCAARVVQRVNEIPTAKTKTSANACARTTARSATSAMVSRSHPLRTKTRPLQKPAHGAKRHRRPPTRMTAFEARTATKTFRECASINAVRRSVPSTSTAVARGLAPEMARVAKA